MTQRTGLGAPARERPKLLSDQPRGARVVLVAALLAGTFVLGHIVRYDYAAIYYNLLELWHPVTAGYHHLVPDATWRHEGRYAVEGLYSGRLGADRVLQLRPALAAQAAGLVRPPGVPPAADPP